MYEMKFELWPIERSLTVSNGGGEWNYCYVTRKCWVYSVPKILSSFCCHLAKHFNLQLKPIVCSRVDVHKQQHTVKPPNKGHFGDGPVIPCREVVLFLEVFF